MVHHNGCPLCSSEKIAFHFSCIDHFISKETFALNRCNVCGFVFTQDYPAETEIYKYYESDDYISHTDTSKGIINKIYRLVRQAMLINKRGLIKKLTGLKEGSLLDIGSGTGHFAATMEKAGWLAKGVEINEKARDFSSSAFGLEIIGPEKISTLNANSFDCVTMWHVLEHFHDPFKCLSEVNRLLKPGGFCLIALPNCGSYDAEHYRQFWAAYDVPRHLWHFSPFTLRLFSEKAGMALEKSMMLPLDVFYISLLSERYKGLRWPIISGFTKALFFSFLSAFNNKRCSSVIYIVRKSLC